jgi:hypothetical protein
MLFSDQFHKIYLKIIVPWLGRTRVRSAFAGRQAKNLNKAHCCENKIYYLGNGIIVAAF